jgi:hypothetical protein
MRLQLSTTVAAVDLPAGQLISKDLIDPHPGQAQLALALASFGAEFSNWGLLWTRMMGYGAQAWPAGSHAPAEVLFTGAEFGTRATIGGPGHDPLPCLKPLPSPKWYGTRPTGAESRDETNASVDTLRCVAALLGSRDYPSLSTRDSDC